MSVTVAQIARLIQDDEILLKNLVLFSTILEIPNSVFRPLLRQYNCDNLSVYELIAGVLETWVSLQPSNGATIQELCNKFSTLELVNLSEKIKALSNDTSSMVTTRAEFSKTEAYSSTLSFNVKSAVDHFVGREQELLHLRNLMNATSFRKPVIISGINGVGKTQLIAAFTSMIKRELSTPPVVGIISMKSEAHYKSSTKAWLEKLDQWHRSDNVSSQTTVRCLYSGLQEAVKKIGWVIVLEDVRNFNADYKELVIQLLAKDAFVVMTTSKLDMLPDIVTDNIILGQLSNSNAEEMLRKNLKVPAGDIVLQTLSSLVPKIPLILNMIVPYVRQKDFDAVLRSHEKNGLTFVLDKLQNPSPLQVLDMIDIGSDLQSFDRLSTTLDILISYIKLENNVCGKRGYLILEVMSLLDEYGVDVHYLREVVQELIPSQEHIPQTDFLDSIELLTRFQFITLSNDRAFPVKLIQEVFRKVMNQSVQNESNQRSREYSILYSVLAQGVKIHVSILHQFWSHGQNFSELITEFPGIPMHLIEKRIYNLSDPRLVDFALRNIKLLSLTLSNNHEAILKLRCHLGVLFAYMRQPDKSLDAYLKVWPDMKAKYGETHSLTVAIANVLAKKLSEDEQYQNALDWYMRLQVWDYKDHRKIEIADTYMKLQRYVDAKKILEEYIAHEEEKQSGCNQHGVDLAKRYLESCISDHEKMLRTVNELQDLALFRLHNLGPDNEDTIEASRHLAETLSKVTTAIKTVPSSTKDLKMEILDATTFIKSEPKKKTSRLCSSIPCLGSLISKHK